MKDKEIGGYINVIQFLKKENYNTKMKLEKKEGFARTVELEDKLKDLEKKNWEL